MIFGDWFRLLPLSAGDWPFLFKETIESFSFLPLAWANNYSGMGGPNYGSGLVFFFELTTKLLNRLFLSWALIERLVWFWPFLVLTVFSSWYLAKAIGLKGAFRFFCPLIFLFNTYILMVVGGGQMGVAMAYALAPLVLAMFINRFKDAGVQRRRGSILTGVVLAIQVMFDPRIALITLGAIGLYLVFTKDTSEVGALSTRKVLSEPSPALRRGEKAKSRVRWECHPRKWRERVSTLMAPVAIAIFLHSFWLLPIILSKSSVLPIGYGEAGWVEFLSFSDFSNTLSLLHPNWPENIFGKVYFMQAEFLILPILAFSSLLFLPSLDSRMKTNKKRILANPSTADGHGTGERMDVLCFASLALIGAFLAKGSNPPFGGVYLWLFANLPGMSLFRDPTKFYLLVALSYSILIPYSLLKIYRSIMIFSNHERE